MEKGKKIGKEDFSIMCCQKHNFLQFSTQYYCLFIGIHDTFSNLNNVK